MVVLIRIQWPDYHTKGKMPREWLRFQIMQSSMLSRESFPEFQNACAVIRPRGQSALKPQHKVLFVSVGAGIQTQPLKPLSSWTEMWQGSNPAAKRCSKAHTDKGL